MTESLKTYISDVVLPCKGFNLWHYMSCSSPTKWDFLLIREELDRLEQYVKDCQAGKEVV